MKCQTIAAIVVLTLVLCGCATITSNEMQMVSLNTKSADGQAVDQAKCSLRNDKGAWEMLSPGFVSVRRSAEDLLVECKKEGFADGFVRAISRAAGGMFGNILFGGGIGALIDHNKGTGYDYPGELPVKMGTASTVDKAREQQQAGSTRSDDIGAPTPN